jgi:MerR family transcriptional regulator, copper efflux regulator
MPSYHRLPLAPRPEVAGDPAGQADDPDEVLAGDARLGEELGARRRDLMQIGDLAREVGKTVRAIHLYEELGLLAPAGRSKGGFRLYAREALLRIRWIGKLQEMGFSLGDIQTIVREWEQMGSAPGAMKGMRDVYVRKLEETREQLRRLASLAEELVGSVAYLDTCDVCDPQRLLSACNCCDLHDKELDVPELVLGFRATPAAALRSYEGGVRKRTFMHAKRNG